MAKNERKAYANVTPQHLYKMFEEKFDDGVNPYEFQESLGIKLMKDLSKVNFDFENYYYSHIDEEIGGAIGFLGYRRIWVQNGFLSYIGWSAGGDWEYPVYFLIYLDKDGETFRAYIPKEGNVWNYDTKSAFGNDEEADSNFLKKWLKKTHPEIEVNSKDMLESDDADIMLDPVKMACEIRNRFKIV